jgi:acetylornithine deacetylase/succinyl-diaminopimelate desuccinylase-like protein
MMENEAVMLLSDYLRIDTTNPPGNEKRAAEFFAEIFDREGVEYKLYEPEPGRSSIRACLRGSGDKGAVILLNHMDVVSADAGEWSFDPFGGEVRDGFVSGRGALDMKGQGIMELLAFLSLKRKGVNLARDCIFLAVADEEKQGYNGVRFLLDNYPEDFHADVVLNEGGIGITGLVQNKPVIMIAVAEKGMCWLRVSRQGQTGHGSMPHGNNALEKMIQALSPLVSIHPPATITPVVAEYFKALGNGMDVFNHHQYDGKADTLVKILAETGLDKLPQISAMIRNTISVNMMHAGTSPNVIPDYVAVEMDIRILPGQDTEEMMKCVRSALSDDTIRIDRSQIHLASESPRDTESYLTIKDVLEKAYPGSITAPLLMMASSDSRFFRERGIASYGVSPIIIPMEQMSMIHGIDEKISVQNLIKGTEVYSELVRKLCA